MANTQKIEGINLTRLEVAKVRELIINFSVLAEDPRGCWPWYTGQRDDGYGCIRVSKKLMLAHRVSYAAFNGPIADNLLVLHACDNRPCINPHHLSLGSHKDNALDCDLRGGRVTVLTYQKATEIRDRLKSGENRGEIAKAFGVSRVTVCGIANNTTWDPTRYEK